MLSSLSLVNLAKTSPQSIFHSAKISIKFHSFPSLKTPKNSSAFVPITWNRPLLMPLLRLLPNLKTWKSSVLTSVNKSLLLDWIFYVNINFNKLVYQPFQTSRVKFWPKSLPSQPKNSNPSICLTITQNKSTMP